jgi:hypothetical protein
MAKRSISNLLSKYESYRKKIESNLDRIREHDPDSVILEKWNKYYQPITSENPNYNAVRTALKDIKDLYNSGATSLEKSERSIANTIDTLKRKGYGYVNRKNFNSFMRFLDDARARGLGSLYSSTQLIDLIKEAKDKKLTEAQIRANIDKWARQTIKYDQEGKVIEVENPRRLYVRRVTLRKRS